MEQQRGDDQVEFVEVMSDGTHSSDSSTYGSEDEPKRLLSSPLSRLIRVLSLSFLLFVSIWLVLDNGFVAENVEQILEFTDENPLIGFIMFVSIYVFNSVLLLPVFILTLGIGFVCIHHYTLFPGVIIALLYSFVGAIAGEGACFFLGRSMCRPRIRGLHIHAESFEVEEKLLRHRGFAVVALLRLAAALPCGITNYALSMSSVRYLSFLLGTIGHLPHFIMLICIGGTLTSLQDATSGVPGTDQTQSVLIYTSVSLTIVATVYIMYLARKELHVVRRQHQMEQNQRAASTTIDAAV